MESKPKRKSNNPFGRPLKSDKPLKSVGVRMHPDLVDEFKAYFKAWHSEQLELRNQAILEEPSSKQKQS